MNLLRTNVTVVENASKSKVKTQHVYATKDGLVKLARKKVVTGTRRRTSRYQVATKTKRKGLAIMDNAIATEISLEGFVSNSRVRVVIRYKSA